MTNLVMGDLSPILVLVVVGVSGLPQQEVSPALCGSQLLDYVDHQPGGTEG